MMVYSCLVTRTRILGVILLNYDNFIQRRLLVCEWKKIGVSFFETCKGNDSRIKVWTV